MRRREFITLVGGAVAWPIAARGQQELPVIGYLNGASAAAWKVYLAAFLQGLKETGYVEGKNVRIEYRWAENQYDRLAALAAGLVRSDVALIFSDGGTVTALAAQKATKTIPIVFMTGADPIKAGLVASLNRPGGNLTGVTIITNLVITKRLELLHELLPRIESVGLLLNPGNPNAEERLADVRAAAAARGWSIKVFRAGSEHDFEAVFATLVHERIGGLLVQADPFFFSQRDRLASLAAHHAVPAIYEDRGYAEAGGLMSYGANRTEPRRTCGVYAGRILKGEKPADLPVQQPTKFELVINAKAAKSLGLVIPDRLLALADEVVE
jgi:putative tryptophan/tyrosine transport system substrate-binding protein